MRLPACAPLSSAAGTTTLLHGPPPLQSLWRLRHGFGCVWVWRVSWICIYPISILPLSRCQPPAPWDKVLQRQGEEIRRLEAAIRELRTAASVSAEAAGAAAEESRAAAAAEIDAAVRHERAAAATAAATAVAALEDAIRRERAAAATAAATATATSAAALEDAIRNERAAAATAVATATATASAALDVVVARERAAAATAVEEAIIIATRRARTTAASARDEAVRREQVTAAAALQIERSNAAALQVRERSEEWFVLSFFFSLSVLPSTPYLYLHTGRTYGCSGRTRGTAPPTAAPTTFAPCRRCCLR